MHDVNIHFGKSRPLPTFFDRLATFEKTHGRIESKPGRLAKKSSDNVSIDSMPAKSEPGDTARAIEALITKSATVTKRDTESQAQAYTRILSENPRLYEAWLIAKRNETTGGGNKDARQAFSIQAIMKSVEDGTSIDDAILKLGKQDAGLYARARMAGLPQIEGMPC